MEAVPCRMTEAQAAPSESTLSPNDLRKALHFFCWDPDEAFERQTLNLGAEQTFHETLDSAEGLFRETPPRERSVFFTLEGQRRETPCEGHVSPSVISFRRYLLKGTNYLTAKLTNIAGQSLFTGIDGDNDLSKVLLCLLCLRKVLQLSVGGEHKDVVDAQERKKIAASKVFILRFLHHRSVLPRSLRRPPIIEVFNDAELLRMSGRRTAAAPDQALWLEKFVAFLWGVKSGAQLFWRIDECGLSFDSFATPTGTMCALHGISNPSERTFFFLLLRNGDRLPIISLPEGKGLQIYCRLGADVNVTNGRLVATSAPSPADPERWVLAAAGSDLCKKLSAASSRRLPLTTAAAPIAGRRWSI